MYAEKRRTACLQEVLREMQSLLHDDSERRIVVIIHLLKEARGYTMYEFIKNIVLGYIKCTHSDGSSPVTTSNALLPDFSCIFYLNVSVVGLFRCSTCWSVKIGTFLLCILINNYIWKIIKYMVLWTTLLSC